VTQLPDGAAVVITTADMYRELVILTRTVDHLAAELNPRLRQVDDHETRLRGLERRLWAGLGVAGVLMPAASAFITTRLTGA
jgi:hypothetical protein